ncbi:hypothetical protein [Achromobacter xylosoxidans]|uniref:hypothetical protein n=1 Tax=Alcaligenes xylosoxydans xylosoxydans TaxID=85698 RepID=UPI001F0F40E8|nr:hypothetical protein [Achromobacter xylosoxidans]MCH4582519.1 hypothetical protein [Achromobacter xylosoxidans]
MHNFYASFVLWLIRPALERHSSIKVKITAESLPTLDGISARISSAALGTAVQPQIVTDGALYKAGVALRGRQ